MKTNKKAILGMLVAMVMSLGVMQGINTQKQNGDINIQQCFGLLGAMSTAESTVGERVGYHVTTTIISGIVGIGCPPLGIGLAF